MYYYIIVVVFSNYTATKMTERKTIEKSEYLKKARIMDYRKAMLDEYKEGDLFILKGKISQIVDNETIKMETKKDNYYGIYSGDSIVVRYVCLQTFLDTSALFKFAT
jgi:hypothetical protein